jgi:hypothetical protein
MKSRRNFSARKITSLAVAVLSCLTLPLNGTPVEPGPQAANARSQPPALPPDTVNLIHALSAQPELMNLSYLRYIIGAPENERSQYALKAKNYHWYQEPRRNLAYELHQDGPRNGVITRSVFTIHQTPETKLSTKEMERVFGQNHTRVFDHQSYPTDVYSLGPNTYVSFTQPTDTFRVNKIAVGYEGAPLPPAPEQAVVGAYVLGKNKAIEIAMKTGHWGEAITWLRRDASLRPADPYVHIQLGQAYKTGLMLNEAISSYSKAALLGANDPEVQKICRAAFVDLKVLPPEQHAPPQDRRGYVAGGQPFNGAPGL